MTFKLIILFVILQIVLCDPYCKVTEKYQNSRIFTTIPETFPYFLDDFITGENISFVNKTTLPGGHIIHNPIEEVRASTQTQIDDEFVAVSSYENSDGTVTTAILTINDNDDGYDINYGYSLPGEVLPQLNMKMALSYYKDQYECYDIIFLDKLLFIIGCINITSSDGDGEVDRVSKTELILVNGEDLEQINFAFDSWEDISEHPDNMKIEVYEPFLVTDSEQIIFNDHFFDQTYILVSYLFEGYNSNYETSIDVFRFVLDEDDLSNSVIIQHAPIDFSVLSDPNIFYLTIADFAVYDDYIFLLEEDFGVYSFWMWGDEISNIQQVNPNPGEQYLALDVSSIGEEYYFTFVSATKIYEYKMIELEEQMDSYMEKQFEASFYGIQLEDWIPIQSNEEYITLRIGSLVYIYDRKLKGLLRGTVSNAAESELLFSDDLLIFNENLIEHRRVERPVLEISETFGAQEGEFVIELMAISTVFNYHEYCSIVFNSTVFDDQDYKGIEFTNIVQAPYYNGSADEVTYFPMDLEYVGPNLSYQVTVLHQPESQQEKGQNSKSKLKDSELYTFPDVPRNVSYISIQQNEWQNVIVAKVEHRDDFNFYAIFQFTDYTVKIFDCYVNDDNSTSVSCKDPCTMKLAGEITSWDVGKMDDDDSRYVWTFVDNGDIIHFYSFKCSEVSQITRYVQNYDVIDIEIIDNLLYVLYDEEDSSLGQGTAQIDVRVFDNKMGFLKQMTIDNDTLQNFPDLTTDMFNPTKIQLSEDYDNVLFIEMTSTDFQQNSVYVLYVDNRRVDYVTHYTFYEEIETYITGDSLFIYNIESGFIREYSLRNLDNIILMKDLPIYNFDIIRNKVMSSPSNLLYAIAISTSTQNNNNGNEDCNVYALIYHSHHMLIDSLYSALQIDCDKNLMRLIIHVDGITKDTMVVVNNGALQFFRIPKSPSIVVAADIDEDVYVDKFNYRVTTIPWDPDYDKYINTYTMQLLNQQLLTRMNQEQFHMEGYDQLALPQNDPYLVYTIDDSGLHKGSIFKFNLECLNYTSDCRNGNIKLTNKAEVVDYDIDFISEAADLYYDDVDTYRLYVLSTAFIYILDQDQQLVEPKIMLGIDTNSLVCHTLTPIYSSQQELEFMLVFCQNVVDPDNTYETYIPVSFLTIEPIAGTPITLKEIESMDQVQVDSEYIFINDLEKNVGNGIYVFAIDFSQPDQTSSTIINEVFFEVVGPFEIMSFEILPTLEESSNKMLIADRYMRFFAFDYKNSLENLKKGITQHEFWEGNLLDQIKAQTLFYTDTTYLEKTLTMDIEDGESGFLNYTTLVHLSDTAIYYVMFAFDEDQFNDDNIYFTVKGVYNNYGSYESQLTLKGNSVSGLFGEVYKNPDKDEILMCIYDLEGMDNAIRNQKNQPNTITFLPVLPITAAVVYKNIINYDIIDNYEFYEDSTGQWHMIIIDQLNQTLQGIKYSKEMTITVKSGVKEQTIGLQAVSDYATSDDIFISNLYQKATPTPPPHHSKSFPGWAIAVIVIGSLALVGAGIFGFYLYKKKKQNSDTNVSEKSRFYQQVTEENQVSMQQQAGKGDSQRDDKEK